MKKVSESILKEIYTERPVDVKKYDHGLLLVIGGSDFYSGSPALSAMAAFRSGADMVRILAPKRAADIIASFSPNLAAYPLEGKYFDKEDLPTVLSQTKSAEIVSHGKTAVVIGGGMGRSEETQDVVLKYLSEVSIPVVIDADAIYAVAKAPAIIAGKDFLLTPHIYEFSVLTGKDISNQAQEEKIKVVQEEAKRLQTTILLKGSQDIISNGEEVVVNEIGSPYMTVGGSGDVLAGICGSLMARGVDVFRAAQAAALINGEAGRLAAKTYGEGLAPVDIIEAIVEILPNFAK